MKKGFKNIFERYYLLLAISLIVFSLAFFYFNRISAQFDKEQSLQELQNSLETELAKTSKTLQQLNSIRRYEDLKYSELNTDYSFFLLNNGRLVFWSDFHYMPNISELRKSFTVSFLKDNDSYYLLRKHLPEDNDHEIVFIVPLIERFAIVNEYLRSKANEHIFSSENIDLSSEEKEGFLPVRIAEITDPVFYVKFGANYKISPIADAPLFYFLIIIGIVFLLLFLWQRTQYLFVHQHHFRGFVELFIWLVVIRALMIYYAFPLLYFPNELFNPRNYASSVINPSLGDLLLNIIFLTVLTVIFFRHYHKFSVFQRFSKSGKPYTIAFEVLLSFITYALLSLFFVLFNSINFHSQWSLDISKELVFHLLKITSYVIVILAGVCTFLLTHIIFKSLIRDHKENYRLLWLKFTAGTVLFIIISIIDNWDFVIITVVNSLYFILLATTNLPRYTKRVQYLTFVYLFIGSIPLCIIGSYSIYRYQQKKILQEKERIAGTLMVENDVLTEILLEEASRKIKEDVFIQNRIFNPYVSKVNIRQRVQRLYLNNQLEKYEVDVFLYNSRGIPLDDGKRNLDEVKAQFSEYKLDSTLYFINQYEGTSLNRYIKIVEIKRYNRTSGYVLIDLRMRRVIPDSVYPMLLIDNRYSGPELHIDYSYAIYRNKQLIFNTGDYNYAESLGRKLKFENSDDNRVKLGGYNHFLVDGGDDKEFVISLSVYPFQNAFSNFSFLFVFFLSQILLALIVVTVYFKIKGVQQNYAARIQLFLNGAFLVPLLIVSISSLSVVIRSYNENLELENLEKSQNISTRLSSSLESFLTREIGAELFSDEVNNISQFAEIDINVFANSGRLITSSQPLIYENELLAELINPQALYAIRFENSNGLVLEEEIGELHYKNTYTPIKSLETGKQIGILSLPFFDVREELEDSVISVLTSVLNIFTVTFIIFLVLSYFVTTWLTFPLRLITQKIRKTSLLDQNEPLEWNSDDEIGLMVGEYNKMLLNLEESKKALAKSEKESAWREIARQVAHEIKNPLTPMQLTLQHMRRTLTEENIDKNKRVQQIDGLLHQINTLSDIATSFSTFAKMPVPQNEPFELSELIRESVEIYGKEEGAMINLVIEEEKFIVDADRKWLGQAISNIIINGIHAAEDQKEKQINVMLKMRGRSKCLLSISDNGKGIEDDIINKIFAPNFSTKEKGSGIGLAIAKRAVEHAGGDIWFESVINEGTTFYIELPVYQ